MQTVSYDHYALRRDVNTVAKFVARIAAHREKLALWQFDSTTHAFPRPVGKDAKWPAYEAAHRLEKSLDLPTHASSVPELAALLAVVLPTTL